MILTPFTPHPEIQSERLLLREIQLSDINEVFFLRSDSEIRKHINKTSAKSHEEAADWITLITDLKAKEESINWGITLKNDSKVIGNICIWRIQKENYRAELGYSLHPAFHRMGIMTEAIKAVLNFGFETMNLHSIEARVNPANEASIGILLKNNFEKEAYFKEDYFYAGNFYDTAIYSLLNRIS